MGMTSESDRRATSSGLIFKSLFESKLFLSLSVGVVSALAVCIAILAGTVAPIDRSAFDYLFRHASHPEDADTSVVIAAIDQKSLVFFDQQKVGWPWPREFYAILLDYLKTGGAKAVAFDMDFSQRDVDRLNVDARESDSSFASAIGRSGNVILTTVLVRVDTADANFVHVGERFVLPASATRRYDDRYNSIVIPIGEFRSSAARLGVSNYGLDVDGVTRRIPLAFMYHGAMLPQLALAAYGVGHNMSGADLRSFLESVPLDRHGNYLVNWCGKGGPDGVFKYYSIGALIVSAAQLSQGIKPEIAPQTFRDKYVIVGGSAIGLMDFKSTPFTTIAPYPGMEIHATVLSNLIRGDFMRETPLWIIYLLAALFAIAISGVFFRLGNVIPATLITFFLAGLFLLAVYSLFYYFRVWMPVGGPELGLIFGFTFSGAVSYVTEGRRRRELRRVLNRYMSPKVVDEILLNPDDFELGGKEMEATVFFSDIKNFTGLSEKLSPGELVTNLNEYFTLASNIVLDHDAMLDKYIGDAIMAVFGAPLYTDRHAVNACMAAIQVQDQLGRYYGGTRPESKLKFETRIGLNSGKMVIGNIGSLKRLDYTAIGDSVNLASRLEGANKEFGTRIIISESTYELAKEEIEARELDLLRVKGKQVPIRIYELICPKGALSPLQNEKIEMFRDGLLNYRSKKWRKARRIFLSILEKDPADGPSHTYASRCHLLAGIGVPDDWDGIYVMTTK